MSWNNEDVIVSMAMLKIGDKVAELRELIEHEKTVLEELSELMGQWADVLAPPTKDNK